MLSGALLSLCHGCGPNPGDSHQENASCCSQDDQMMAESPKMLHHLRSPPPKCDRICENRPPCKICTLEIRAFECGHVVLDPDFQGVLYVYSLNQFASQNRLRSCVHVYTCTFRFSLWHSWMNVLNGAEDNVGACAEELVVSTLVVPWLPAVNTVDWNRKRYV